ncbi:glycoside hydrolase family 3 protein [Candidatus Parcubacteria bacterium]|nr:glycoside hydrolase family 3 protein [Candidatus Parcubacteria bacterium]
MLKNKVIIILTILIIACFLFYPKSKPEIKIIDQEPQTNEEELKEKIGQMIIIGFRGIEINKDSQIVKDINDLNLGGIILFDIDNPTKTFPRNIINYIQTKKLISDIKELSSSNIFVSIDAEGGLVNRLKEKYGFINIPSAEDMGKENPEKTKEYAIILGKELKELGFNINFAPVVDVNTNKNNPVIGKLERSFSSDPEKVFIHASSFIEGLNSQGIISSIKHFPGHGSSSSDSHLGMVDVTNTYDNKELVPYQKLIESGYSQIVMTAHIMNTKIDPVYPATLSPSFIKKILRDDLGFKGVVVSDDMHMGAIVDHYGFNESLIKAIDAGCDILIISNNGKEYNENTAKEAVEAIFNAVQSGQLSEERIIESYDRIKNLKQDFEIK